MGLSLQRSTLSWGHYKTRMGESENHRRCNKKHLSREWLANITNHDRDKSKTYLLTFPSQVDRFLRKVESTDNNFLQETICPEYTFLEEITPPGFVINRTSMWKTLVRYSARGARASLCAFSAAVST